MANLKLMICIFLLLILAGLMLSCVPSYLKGHTIPFENHTDFPDSLLNVSNSADLYATRKIYSLWSGWIYQNNNYGRSLRELKIKNGKIETRPFIFFAPLWVRNRQMHACLSIANEVNIVSLFYNKRNWYTGPITFDEMPLDRSLSEGIVIKQINCKVHIRKSLKDLIATDSVTSAYYKGYSYTLNTPIVAEIEKIPVGFYGSALTVLSDNPQEFTKFVVLPIEYKDKLPNKLHLQLFQKNNRKLQSPVPLVHLSGDDYLLEGKENEQTFLNFLLYVFTIHQDMTMVRKVLESGLIEVNNELLNNLLSEVFSEGYKEREHPDFKQRNLEITEYLVNKGANPSTRNDEGDEIIFKAGMNRCNKTVSFLLSKGASPDVIVSNKLLLEFAAGWNNEELCHILLKAGAKAPDKPSEELKKMMSNYK